jgi:inner membrane protein
MENVCHTLAGFALARTGAGRSTPLAATALVVGANLPDIDLAWSSFHSALAYFHYHRGWTHSIAGSVVLTILWWLALLAADRWLLAGKTPQRARPGPLLLAAAIGIGSHILMDAANTYGIRPFLPWDERWVYGDLWVIVDPWLWLILGGAVYLGRESGRRRDLVWLMGAGVAAIVVLFAPQVPASCRAAWAAGLALTIAICRGAARAGAPAPRAAIAGVGLAFLYAVLCAASHGAALARVARMAAAVPATTPRRIAAFPRPADPLRWEWIIADASSLRHGVVGALPSFDPPAAPITVLSRGLAVPAVESLMRSCAGEVIGGFFRFPFAAVEEQPDGGRVVVVRDARYTRKGRGFAVYAAPLGADGRPVIDRTECP